jgi:pyruvate-formate lyase-activating enzyme
MTSSVLPPTDRDPVRLRRLQGPPLAKEVTRYTRAELRDYLRDDPWLSNLAVNLWEYHTGQSELTTYPWDVSIPVADVCNARCPFCTSWYAGTRCLHLDEIDRFAAVLRHARLLCLGGHGEPLVHPEFDELGRRLTAILDPRCEAYIITNGVLIEKYFDVLCRCTKGYNISLNAATPATHHEVMHLGLDAFGRIIENVRKLIAFRDSGVPGVYVNLSFVVIEQNVHELVRYIELANALRVDRIYVRTLAPQQGVPHGLNYHLLPPYRHPQFPRFLADAREAVAKSKVPVTGDLDSLATPIFPAETQAKIDRDPPRFVAMADVLRDKEIRAQRPMPPPAPIKGQPSQELQDRDLGDPYGRTARFWCRAPYQCLYLNSFDFRVVPCCYMVQVPGFEPTYYDGSFDFFEIWNSPAMTTLRARLSDGPLLGNCRVCPPVY